MKRTLSAISVVLLACHPSVDNPAPKDVQLQPPTVELTEMGMQNAHVKTAVLTPTAFSPQLVVQGTIIADPRDIARVGAHMAGRIVAIDVRLGDKVEKNQSLVKIDSVDLHHVSTDYLTSVVRARQASEDLARQERLVTERVGAQAELQRAQAAADSAKATLREAEEHLHFLGLTDGDIGRMQHGDVHTRIYSAVRAPLTGRVESVSAVLGQVLSGNEDLLTIVQSNRVWATLRIYERDLPFIAPGAPVNIQVLSYPDVAFRGVVTSISDLIDTTSRTVEVRVGLDNADGRLKPGMSALGRIAIVAAQRDQLWIPAAAVQMHDGEKIVFVANGERKFLPRAVAVGDERGGYVPVLSGVTAGTEIIVEGALAVRGALERYEARDD